MSVRLQLQSSPSQITYQHGIENAVLPEGAKR
jgi:hypothetical protein